MNCYAKNGDEITVEQWARLIEDRVYSTVKQDRTEKGTLVSTVWLGLDHSFSFGNDPVTPIIFETMVFSEAEARKSSWGEEYQQRYSTEKEAREGHERIFNMVRELEEIDGRAGHTHQAPGSTGSDGQEDQERDHDLRATADVGDAHDPQHPIRPPRSCE